MNYCSGKVSEPVLNREAQQKHCRSVLSRVQSSGHRMAASLHKEPTHSSRQLPTLGLQASAKCILGKGFPGVKTISSWGLRVETREVGGGVYGYQTTKGLLQPHAHWGVSPALPEW